MSASISLSLSLSLSRGFWAKKCVEPIVGISRRGNPNCRSRRTRPKLLARVLWFLAEQ
ncbi:hypothetical protein B296_00022838 [Ensete ventricosum]|uniref:Uncharacterized protein n=1 Tax=Ensete ventricosum TaxID=4639 RepID=A0A427ASM3_ENSVE|nr:hypothetical protein B296_00022838 [Ensete ventricosum]